jgi:hypothetical protein
MACDCSLSFKCYREVAANLKSLIPKLARKKYKVLYVKLAMKNEI